jgi:hypothetical protein
MLAGCFEADLSESRIMSMGDQHVIEAEDRRTREPRDFAVAVVAVLAVARR